MKDSVLYHCMDPRDWQQAPSPTELLLFKAKQSVPVNVFYKCVVQWESTYPELKKSELGGEHRADVLVTPRLTVLHLVGGNGSTLEEPQRSLTVLMGFLSGMWKKDLASNDNT